MLSRTTGDVWTKAMCLHAFLTLRCSALQQCRFFLCFFSGHGR